jgi:hypothetical protein
MHGQTVPNRPTRPSGPNPFREWCWQLLIKIRHLLPISLNRINKRNPIIVLPLRYGLLGSIISIILFLTLYYAGKNPLLIPAILDFRIILFPIILVFAIRDFKENKNKGILHFWQGLSVGFQTVLITSFFTAIFILLFGGLVEEEFVPEYIRLMTDQINSVNEKVIQSIGENAVAKSLELLPSTTIYDLSLDYFLKSLPYGVFLTIIISLILRKKTF